MRPTPRTDTAVKDMLADEFDFVELARTLERELAEAVELIQRIAESVPAERHYEYTTGIARVFLKRVEGK